jgi:mono/diheme cytochrome c family protein
MNSDALRQFRFCGQVIGTALVTVLVNLPASAGPGEGKRLVEANCARCHAVGRMDRSAHLEAPPFRDLWKRYPLDALDEAFAEGIYTGHPDMPEFLATPEQIEAIIGYIGGLRGDEN